MWSIGENDLVDFVKKPQDYDTDEDELQRHGAKLSDLGFSRC
jgi:hypothetical protein